MPWCCLTHIIGIARLRGGLPEGGQAISEPEGITSSVGGSTKAALPAAHGGEKSYRGCLTHIQNPRHSILEYRSFSLWLSGSAATW